MQGITKPQEPKVGFKIREMPSEDKHRLVGVFVWLIKEDKKQHPELYQLKKVTTK